VPPVATPSVLIVSYRRPELLAQCLVSLTAHAPEWPVHVWDNASPEAAAFRALAERHPEVSWHWHEENLGFGAAVNRLAELTEGDLLLLNPDAELLGPPGLLSEALERSPAAAAVGPLVEVAGLRPWDNARRLPGPTRMIVEYWGLSNALRGTPLSQRYRRPPRAAGYVSGACLLIRREAWQQVGPFDERFWLYSEEVDWARRAHAAGWTIALVRQSLVKHIGGASSDSPTTSASAGPNWLLDMQQAYLAKHHGRRAAATYARAAHGFDRLRAARQRRRQA
jgi:GT2 family glycosyltransferase